MSPTVAVAPTLAPATTAPATTTRSPTTAPADAGPVPETGPAIDLRLGAEAVTVALTGEDVRESREGWTVDLQTRGLAVPGLRLTELHVRRGEGGRPGAGTLAGDISAPFVTGQARLTVDAEGNVSGGADARFDVELLGRPRVSFAYTDRRWAGSVTIEGAALQLPIPNVTIDEGRATVAFDGDRLTGRLETRFHHAALGNGEIRVAISERGVEGTGRFEAADPAAGGHDRQSDVRRGPARGRPRAHRLRGARAGSRPNADRSLGTGRARERRGQRDVRADRLLRRLGHAQHRRRRGRQPWHQRRARAARRHRSRAGRQRRHLHARRAGPPARDRHDRLRSHPDPRAAPRQRDDHAAGGRRRGRHRGGAHRDRRDRRRRHSRELDARRPVARRRRHAHGPRPAARQRFVRVHRGAAAGGDQSADRARPAGRFRAPALPRSRVLGRRATRLRGWPLQRMGPRARRCARRDLG